MTSVKLPVNGDDGAPASLADSEFTAEEASEPRAREGMGGLAKGLAIIEAFSATTVRMTVAEAARLADVTRPAARRCLLTLVDLGYLAHDGKFFTPLPSMLWAICWKRAVLPPAFWMSGVMPASVSAFCSSGWSYRV